MAVKLIVGLVQVISVTPVLLVIPAVGVVISWLIVMLCVAEHPFDPVTVTV